MSPADVLDSTLVWPISTLVPSGTVERTEEVRVLVDVCELADVTSGVDDVSSVVMV